jgi:2-amino-4-hydroxy-6-hydroxymethyldihydropteridine diphosphokinase
LNHRQPKVLNKVILLFGSNIEPRLSFLQQAEQKVAASVGRVLQLSRVYESEPWGFQASRAFLNRAAILETDLTVHQVLKQVLSIETELGRQRLNEGYASRQIDIDILYFNKMQITIPELSVPHPGIPDRLFVLLPLVEIAAGFVHPVLKQTQADLLKQCTDELKVWVFNPQLNGENEV